MPEQIISASGVQYGLIVSPEGRLFVDLSGTSIFIGSVSAHVDSIYVQSGLITTQETIPTSSEKNNSFCKFEYITSGTAAGVTGSSVGSIISFIGAGSYVKTITYSNDLVINVGSWV